MLALAFVAYVGSVELGGNGFVSAFVAGLVFGAVDEGNRKAITFTEDVALFASLLVWIVFGAFFVGPVLAGGFAASAVVYAVLSLTRDPYGARRRRPAWRRLPTADDGVHGLVRTAGPRFGGVLPDRGRGPARDGCRYAVARGRDMDHPAVGPAARALGAPAVRCVRSEDRRRRSVDPPELVDLARAPRPRGAGHLQRSRRAEEDRSGRHGARK